jgi:hypothetical protein
MVDQSQPTFFPNKESFALIFSLKNKAGLFIESDSVSPNVLIFHFDFKVVLLVDRVANVVELVQDKYHVAKFIKFIKNYLVGVETEGFQAAENMIHKFTIIFVLQGVP